MGNPEAERHASFYDQPWCDEAVPRYFYAKVGFGGESTVYFHVRGTYYIGR